MARDASLAADVTRCERHILTLSLWERPVLSPSAALRINSVEEARVRTLVHIEQNSRDHDYCHNNSPPKQISASSFCCRRYWLRASISIFLLRHFFFSCYKNLIAQRRQAYCKIREAGCEISRISHPGSRIPNKARNLTPETNPNPSTPDTRHPRLDPLSAPRETHGHLFGTLQASFTQVGIILMARDRTITIVKSEIVLSIIINILARCVSGKASVGLKAVAVLYPRYR